MGPVTTALLATVMLLGCAGALRGALQSLRAADRWRAEVRQAAEDSKGRWRGQRLRTSPRVWRFEGKLVRDERGSLELWGVGLILALTSLLALQALIWRRRQAEVRDHFHQTLCLKEAIGETRRLVVDMGALNQAILAGETSTWALTLLGGIGIAVRPSWEQVKKALQLAQEVRWTAYSGELVRLRVTRCRLPLEIWAGPYERTWALVRTPDGRAKNRPSGTWVWTTPLSQYRVRWELTRPQDRRARWVVL